ncbi:hypothetical protein SH661x_001752 [Planctomicrobium sp. SH661]|uniref:hypothetical protein n=1 Tax=Planctomicrobium sp. SH661 TaxID=3448124 RepID=UPI003F5B572E
MFHHGDRSSYQPARSGVLAILIGLMAATASAFADAPIKIAESPLEQRTYQTQSQITTTGKVQAATGGGKKEDLELSASVTFDFLSRRLPSGGRDALALREAREFNQASLTTSVSGYQTKTDLPADRQLIVSNGNREGIISYSPLGTLTRESLDLLEIPGDPLALLALLPPTEVRPAEEWVPPDWVMQMLTGVEAVETTELKCRLEQATPSTAKVTFQGKIKGQRLGTNTTVGVVGAMLFNLEQNYLSQAKTVYTITSDVGTVNPGLDMQVTTVLARKPVENVGRLTDQFIAAVPLEAPEESLGLQYLADPWGMSLEHGRDWHLFQAVYDAAAPVAILRLVELGSLVAQCNLSPAPPAPGGQTTPLEKFEADIQQSLGERFGDVVSREKLPTNDGRQIYRVEVSGNVVIKSTKGRADIPMLWIYYLVADPNGRQASFVFSVEPHLMEQLRGRDKDLVNSLKFVTPLQNASRAAGQ